MLKENHIKMAYTKLKLTEPIYELQEKETPRQYYFFNIFCHADMTLPKFAKSFKELKKGDTLEDNGRQITLDFNPPKEKTFNQWRSYNQWEIRKRAYWESKINNIREELQKDLVEFFQEDSTELKESAKKDWNIDKQIDTDTRTPPHLKAKGKNELATAHQKKIDTLLIQSGMPNDISKTESDVKIDADVNNEISVSQEDKLKRMQELAKRMETMDYD